MKVSTMPSLKWVKSKSDWATHHIEHAFSAILTIQWQSRHGTHLKALGQFYARK